jgi:prolyl-tRNA synthetase
MLEIYRSFAEEALGMPVIAGEKPPHERFPGAESTFAIEAMMQDGKALQAGTAHYLGTNFARAQNIRYQTEHGDLAFAHTTSWGVSTRLVGGVVMTHGDDDGLRLPPIIAPRQIVLVPILRDRPEDAPVIEYCEALAHELRQATAFGEPIRAGTDRKPGRPVDKRWACIKRGVPVVCEIGARDVAAGAVTLLRRDRTRNGERIHSASMARAQLVRTAPALLAEIQSALHEEARARLRANIRTDLTSFAELEAYYRDSDEAGTFRGWAQVPWARPQGGALEALEKQLKASKLTIRVAPLKQEGFEGKRCVFSGAPAEESVLVGRAY